MPPSIGGPLLYGQLGTCEQGSGFRLRSRFGAGRRKQSRRPVSASWPYGGRCLGAGVCLIGYKTIETVLRGCLGVSLVCCGSHEFLLPVRQHRVSTVCMTELRVCVFYCHKHTSPRWSRHAYILQSWRLQARRVNSLSGLNIVCKNVFDSNFESTALFKIFELSSLLSVSAACLLTCFQYVDTGNKYGSQRYPATKKLGRADSAMN